MSESFVNPLFGQHPPPATEDVVEVEVEVEREGTGHPDVDRVLATLTGLDELPVAEHVVVFEQAHESLRRTLSGAGQDQPAPTRG
jgi:hypothetical protein